MRDYQTYRRAAIRYWEWRRIFYNLALVLPALFGYGLTDYLNYVGDPHSNDVGFLLVWFGLSALGANVCYSLVYALEFFFGSDDPTSRWVDFGRAVTFGGGILLAMLLALIGGRDIASMEFYHQIKKIELRNPQATMKGVT